MVPTLELVIWPVDDVAVVVVGLGVDELDYCGYPRKASEVEATLRNTANGLSRRRPRVQVRPPRKTFPVSASGISGEAENSRLRPLRSPSGVRLAQKYSQGESFST